MGLSRAGGNEAMWGDGSGEQGLPSVPHLLAFPSLHRTAGDTGGNWKGRPNSSLCVPIILLTPNMQNFHTKHGSSS